MPAREMVFERSGRSQLRAAAVLLTLAIVGAAGAGGVAACGGDTGGASTTSSSSSSSGSGGAPVDIPGFYSPPPNSCAYDCANLAKCSENHKPYACPSLDKWEDVPHDTTLCPAWDGTYPKVEKGKCVASAPKGSALAQTGVDPGDPTAIVLPDARRIHPAGKEWIFSDLPGGLTSQVMDIPGTPYVVAVETGYGDHGVRSIDTTLLAAGMDPVASLVTFTAPETLNWGLALRSPDRVYVTSHDGAVHALTFDPATGALTRDDAHAIALPMGVNGSVYASGLAVSPDNTKLVVSLADAGTFSIYSIAPDASYGHRLGKVDLGDKETFQAVFDPNDATGDTVYVSMWGNAKVLAVDISTPAAPKVKATYKTQKDPEGMAFLNGRFLAIADAFGDAITIVDRVSKETTTIPVDVGKQPGPGEEPTILSFDATNARLYVANSGDNAVVAFDVDLAATPPKLTRRGSIQTGWWPSGIAVRATGDLVITTLRGHGEGAIPLEFHDFENDIGDRMHGSVQIVAPPTNVDLAAGDDQVAIDDDPSKVAGLPELHCPGGAHDFPMPETNQGGSPVIDHVFFILRENKNFDSIFGDLANVDGEPTYTMKTSAKDMDAIWHNVRTLARAFTVSDNYYTDAVFSTQGHVLATYGRTSDFNERTWITSGDRDGSPRLVPGAGIVEAGRPAEGSAFDWLFRAKVPFDILGEIVGQPDLPEDAKPVLDIHYPGIAQDIGLVDLPKACYAAGRLRVGCNLGQFVYQTLPNDHTIGVSSSNPTPETMCAVNDEATGMMIDAISHSPYWKSSLVIVTEDDPSQGGEHVDSHRTPLVLISPWVKRGYVSPTHVDAASVHKMIAHVFGLSYPNRFVARAALPLDAFTSTPDFTPYSYTPRTWPLACGMSADARGAGGPAPAAEEELTKLWDFSQEDRQPGLGAQVFRAMRGEPLEKLSPAMRASVRRFAAEHPRDDDD